VTRRSLEEAPGDAPLESLDLELDVGLYDSIVADMEQHAGFHAPAEVWRPESLFPESEEARTRPSFADFVAPWIGNYSREAEPEKVEEVREFVAGLGARVQLPEAAREALKADAPRVVDLRTAHDVALMTAHMRAPVDAPRVLEVGAGYGRLAEAFLSLPNGARYVIVDAVPGSLYYSYAYLRKVLPGHSVGSYYTDGAERAGEFDCYVVPSWHVDELELEPFDLAVNIASFQEMTDEQVGFYLQLFDRSVGPGGTIYISNSRDYMYPRDYAYPANWKLLFKANTGLPFPAGKFVGLHYPVEIFEQTDGDWSLHNALVDREYLLGLYASTREQVERARPPAADAQPSESEEVQSAAAPEMAETETVTARSYDDALEVVERLDPEIQPYNARTVPGRMKQLVAFLQNSLGMDIHGRSVADFGAGHGTPLLWMCLEGGAVGGVAIENNAARLEFMRKLYDTLGLEGVEVRDGDLNEFEGEPSSVDVVTIVDVFAARGVNVRKTFQTAFRMLRPGGALVTKSANWIYKPETISRHPASQLMPRSRGRSVRPGSSPTSPSGRGPASRSGTWPRRSRARFRRRSGRTWSSGASRRSGRPRPWAPALRCPPRGT
jgi:SAM-dependent methyltransferase